MVQVPIQSNQELKNKRNTSNETENVASTSNAHIINGGSQDDVLRSSSLWAGALPEKQGLYDPENEKDSCGVGFICHIKGEQSHKVSFSSFSLLLVVRDPDRPKDGR